MEAISFAPIGVIHTPFFDPKGAPIQPKASKGAVGRVEVFEQFAEGLSDLEGFSHVALLYAFHMSKGFELRVVPYLDTVLRGVFATRAPRRPNPIGLSVVRLQSVDGNVLTIADVDMVDGTPLLDIKPYVPEFDSPPEVRLGWIADRIDRASDTRADDRFAR